MHNVTNHWKPVDGCACEKIKAAIRKTGSRWNPPLTDGHIIILYGERVCRPGEGRVKYLQCKPSYSVGMGFENGNEKSS